MHRPSRACVALALACALAAGCVPSRELTLPSADQVTERYEYDRGLRAEISGNVAVLTVEQDPTQLRRGGSLWAKVGPYVFLFSEETRGLFDDFPGLAGVRVTTEVGGTEVASALLTRDELSDILWRRALNIAGKARRDGTHQVSLVEDLIGWGEDHTEHTYNTRYTRQR